LFAKAIDHRASQIARSMSVPQLLISDRQQLTAEPEQAKVKSIFSHGSGEVPGCFFIIRTVKNGLVAPPVPRFRPNLGLHPSDESRPSPAPWGALGDSGRNKYAGNGEESSRASRGSDLSAREGGRRPHRIVGFPRIVFRAL
jgi:hypothetical protein